METRKPVVAFICVHNACRSQMAEAIAKCTAAESFEAYSAGTEIKSEINADAVAVIRELYGTDMTLTQHPKLLSALPPVDIAVTMGCNVVCPSLPSKRHIGWHIDDPTGKGMDTFRSTAREIERCIRELAEQINSSELYNKESI
jgi:arsenate reductase (thioredoxin)